MLTLLHGVSPLLLARSQGLCLETSGERVEDAGYCPWELHPAVCVGGLFFNHPLFSEFL